MLTVRNGLAMLDSYEDPAFLCEMDRVGPFGFIPREPHNS